MPLLSAAEILAANDIEYRVIDVPEWAEDGQVRVKSLSGKERDAFEDSLAIQRGDRIIRDNRNIRAKLVALGAVDADGKRLFTEQQVSALGDKSLAPLNRLFEAISEMSKLTPEDVEELEGNSAAGQTGDSPSTSPATSGSEL